MRISRSLNPNPDGFTIVELLSFIGVVIILTAIAAPSYISVLPGIRLSDGARQIAAHLQVARMKAISQNVKFRVNLVTVKSYTLQKDSGAGFVTESGPFTLPAGITFSATGPTSEFHPRGTVNTSAGISTITLNNGTQSKQVQITSVGRLKIE